MYVSKAGYRGKKTMIYVDRNGNRTKGTTGQDRLLKFIYTHTATRLLIRPFLSPWVSKLGGTFLSTRLSAVAIRPFVEKNQINLSQYEKQEFASYNEFFTRKIKAEERPVEMDEEVLISPCDGKVSVYPICEKGKFEIKHTAYTAEQLLQDAHLAKHYYGGWIYILRLTVDDYHRYCYVADGIKSSQKKIKGILHTVNPVANDACPIYKMNAREYCLLKTETLGTVLMMEVGALMVGKIKNHEQRNCRVCRGTEKGMFEFEGYLEEDSTAFKELEAKLTPNLERDFDRFKDEVKRVMAAEIVKRYYYQRGELQESLKDDLVLEKALEVLGDPDLYRRTLSVPVELEAATKGTE